MLIFLWLVCVRNFYVAFLKKSSAKNFPEGKAFAHIVRSTVVRDDFVDFFDFSLPFLKKR